MKCMSDTSLPNRPKLNKLLESKKNIKQIPNVPKNSKLIKLQLNIAKINVIWKHIEFKLLLFKITN